MALAKKIKSLFFKDSQDHFDELLSKLDGLFIEFMEVKQTQPHHIEEAKEHIYRLAKMFEENIKVLESAHPSHSLLARKKLDFIKEIINSK